MEKEVRVRFAPSPTGPLHIGGVRTALYNYLFARKQYGKFILRIEDTDQTRFVPGAEQYIIDSLAWCGITFDEGVHIGGPFSPYRQSDRKEIYKKYAIQLLVEGKAYYSFDTAAELDELRSTYELHKQTFLYGPLTRMSLRNSLSLPPELVDEMLRNNVPYVVRIKIPENQIIKVNDLIRGEILVDSSLLDDKVLFKSDGMPTYHLANVVDDYLMQISHVIRGEEWLPSAPLHVLLYKYLGWEEYMPQFAHLPLLLRPDGNGKLSKRDGDRLGFPVFPLRWIDPKSGEVSSGYRESGYLPAAFINMLALLGWNPGDDKEIFSMSELIESFSLERVSKSGAKFDVEKAQWFNHQYIMKLSPKALSEYLFPILAENDQHSDPSFVIQVCALIQDRVSLIPDLWKQSSFFFLDPDSYDENVISKIWKSDTSLILRDFAEFLQYIEPFDKETLEFQIKEFVAKKGIGIGQLMNPFRLAVVGSNFGPGMIDIAALLGKERVISRIRKGINVIKI